MADTSPRSVGNASQRTVNVPIREKRNPMRIHRGSAEGRKAVCAALAYLALIFIIAFGPFGPIGLVAIGAFVACWVCATKDGPLYDGYGRMPS